MVWRCGWGAGIRLHSLAAPCVYLLPLHINPHLDVPPGIDLVEGLLTCLFLRRYVPYCARRKWYARMQGALKLHREIENSSAYRSDAVIKSEKGPSDNNGPCRKNY